jgi:ribonuclease HII
VAVGIQNLLAKNLSELRREYLAGDKHVPDELIQALESDPRSGARQLAGIIRKRRLKNRREGQRLHHLLRYELDLWNQGIQYIAGVDEAGIGPLAGPVVAAAVILPRKYKLRELDDSKKILNEGRREELAAQIKQDAVCWALGRADVEEIDALNIYHAGLLAMRRAVEGLTVQPEHVLVDARTIPYCPCRQTGIVHGDALSASIAAASILAKTTRDGVMRTMHKIYPAYGFASHKGYPTGEHLKALKINGVLPIHRRSFEPVRRALGLEPVQRELFGSKKTGVGSQESE